MNQSIIILCGAPFSGKSRLAKQLNSELGLKIASYDNDIYAIHKHKVPKGTTPAKEYEAIQATARKHLGNLLLPGESIIYDDLCLEKDDRNKLKQVADEYGVGYILVFLDTPELVIQQRRDANLKTLARDHISDKKLKLDLSLLERPGADENPIIVSPDTPFEEVVNRIRRRL
ncbi:MAG TPA: AAA family ATPase [Candidatus Saccharimonadales bacterium]|nr:AAA family ATPase [Candidatus Saccharimonadales bacterium]